MRQKGEMLCYGLRVAPSPLWCCTTWVCRTERDVRLFMLFSSCTASSNNCHCEWFRMEFELLAWGTSTSWCVTPVSGNRRQPLLLPRREEHTRPASCETSLTNLIFRLLLDMKTKAFRILALVLLFCLFKKFWANVTRWGSRWNRVGYVYMGTPAFSDPTINIASEKSS